MTTPPHSHQILRIALLVVIVFAFYLHYGKLTVDPSRNAPVSTATAVPPGQLMTLDPTRKFLINSNSNKPVFVTGDDAFSLQSQLSDADIQFYLNDRASKGFNAIWIALADNFYSNHPPKDFYGNVPFDGPDFTNENPKYWARVDHTLSAAAALGISVFANPGFVGYGCKEGYCESYRSSSAETVAAYGKFLGDRYKGYSNIVWLVGGDADSADSNVQSKLDALAKAIKSADPAHLMTSESYRGHSSAEIWSGAPWLDLNALYSLPPEIPARANAAFLAGRYPVFMLEDWYEGEHSMTELDIRKEGYWAALSGATLGRFFGNFVIWDFNWPKAPADSWKTQLNAAGSVGQSILGKLFRSREHWLLVPDTNHSVMTSGYDPRSTTEWIKDHARNFTSRQVSSAPSNLAVAARTSDGKTIIAYIPNGNGATITIDMAQISDAASQAKGWWFNPRDNSSQSAGELGTAGKHNFTPPDANDWILVIDSAGAHLPPPGSSEL